MAITDRAKRVEDSYRKLTGLEAIRVDASEFQEKLSGVATAMTNLIEREGAKIIPHPFMHFDFALILRQGKHICNLFCSLNAEERLEKDPSTKQEYSFTVLPLVRSLIDGFYNVTVMLEDPSLARLFRASGYQQILLDSEDDAKRYGTDQRCIDHHQLVLSNLSLEWRRYGFTEDEIRSTKKWTLLTGYLRKNPTDTPHKILLRSLTLGFWKEYSAVSHGTFDGLRNIAPFISRDVIPRAWREDTELGAYRVISMHMARAHGLLLCLLTELQAVYQFQGAEINNRLVEVWDTLIALPEIRELYELRYKNLMKDRNIVSAPWIPPEFRRYFFQH